MRNMKKFVLSATLIVMFGLYAFSRMPQAKISVTNPTPSYLPPTPRPSPSGAGPTPSATPRGIYRNGTFTGDVTDAYYGNVQVQAVVRNGALADVVFLDYPHDRRTSVAINTQATPMLRSEALQVQSAQVDVISGATATSEAFVQSLASALAQAKN